MIQLLYRRQNALKYAKIEEEKEEDEDSSEESKHCEQTPSKVKVVESESSVVKTPPTPPQIIVSFGLERENDLIIESIN